MVVDSYNQWKNTIHIFTEEYSFSDKKKHIYRCKHSHPLAHILHPLRLLRFVLRYSKVTVTNPSRLKCLPSKSRFQAELQLCVEARESSDERLGRLRAVGAVSLRLPGYSVNKPWEGTSVPRAGCAPVPSRGGGLFTLPRSPRR